MLRTTSKKYGAVLAVVLMALTGCGTTTTGGLTTSTQSSDVTGSTQTQTTETAQATQQAQVLVGTFGQTITLSDGIAITTTATVRKAGEYAYGAVDGKIVVIKVEVTNTAGVTQEANSETYPRVTYGEHGETAQSAYDSDSVIAGITQVMLAGETQTAVHEYGITTEGLASVRVEYVSYKSLETMQTVVIKGEVK